MADKHQLIDLLIHLRIPGAHEALRHPVDDASLSSLRDEVDAYRAELEALPDGELETLVAFEEARLRREKATQAAQREERERFFDKPGATPDFLAWSLMVSWTLDQAAALLLGKDPAVVTWERVRELVDVSAFAREFAKVRAYLEGAAGKFPVAPIAFVDWAENNDVPVPTALADAVRHASGSSSKPADRNQIAPTPIDGTQREAAFTEIIRLWPTGHPGLKQPQMKEQVDRELKKRGLVAQERTFRRALGDARRFWSSSKGPGDQS